MGSLHRNHEHRAGQVEQPRWFIDEVVLLGGERDPSCVATIADASVQAHAKVAHAQLSDDASRAEISLHWSRQMCEVPVGDRRRWRDARHTALDFAVVRGPQADRSLSTEAKDNADKGDEIAERAELRIGPGGDDAEHRDENGARTNRPPPARPHKQRSGCGEKKKSREKP